MTVSIPYGDAPMTKCETLSHAPVSVPRITRIRPQLGHTSLMGQGTTMTDYQHLLPSEQEAVKLILRHGQERCSLALKRIGDRMERRAQQYNDERVYFDYAFDAMAVATPRELQLMYLLKLGLMLTDTYNTPAAARERILKRRAAQRAAAQARRAVH